MTSPDGCWSVFFLREGDSGIVTWFLRPCWSSWSQDRERVFIERDGTCVGPQEQRDESVSSINRAGERIKINFGKQRFGQRSLFRSISATIPHLNDPRVQQNVLLGLVQLEYLIEVHGEGDVDRLGRVPDGLRFLEPMESLSILGRARVSRWQKW